MIRRTVVRGAVVLAATSAAALSACGSDEAKTDGNGGAASGGSSTGGTVHSEGGAPSDGGSPSGGASSGGTGGDGTAGAGGFGGFGGAPQALTATEEIDDNCTGLASAYEVYSGTARDDVLSMFSSEVATAIAGLEGKDTLSYPTNVPSNVLHCLVGGPGDDTFNITGAAGGYFNEYYGTLGEAELHTGSGADVIDYAVTLGVHPYFRPAAQLKDFKSGTDKIRLQREALDLLSTSTAETISVLPTFALETASPNVSCDFTIIVDSSDGEVWMSRNCESSNENILIMDSDGDAPAVSDFEIYSVGP